jgi:hypothetical protein
MCDQSRGQWKNVYLSDCNVQNCNVGNYLFIENQKFKRSSSLHLIIFVYEICFKIGETYHALKMEKLKKT